MARITKTAAFNVRVDPLLKREVVALTEALGGNPSAIITRAIIDLLHAKRAALAAELPCEKRKLADLTALFLKATNENKDALALSDFASDDEPGRAFLAAYLADWKVQDDNAPDALDVATIEDEMRMARTQVRRLSAALAVVEECQKARDEAKAQFEREVAEQAATINRQAHARRLRATRQLHAHLVERGEASIPLDTLRQTPDIDTLLVIMAEAEGWEQVKVRDIETFLANSWDSPKPAAASRALRVVGTDDASPAA